MLFAAGALIVRDIGDLRLEDSCPAEGGIKGGGGNAKFVADLFRPDNGATGRSDAAPPKFTGGGLLYDGVPVGDDVLLPDIRDGSLY